MLAKLACCLGPDPIACSASCAAHHAHQKGPTRQHRPTWDVACAQATASQCTGHFASDRVPQLVMLCILPGSTVGGHAMRPTASREASRHAVSSTDPGPRSYLHTVAEKFLQKIHAVAASAPPATWWTEVASETPNNISFITSFGASPRACSSCYICEPQSTAEGHI